ncbi:hypothetical protein V2J09_009624 [Rumex salicifolius]
MTVDQTLPKSGASELKDETLLKTVRVSKKKSYPIRNPLPKKPKITKLPTQTENTPPKPISMQEQEDKPEDNIEPDKEQGRRRGLEKKSAQKMERRHNQMLILKKTVGYANKGPHPKRAKKQEDKAYTIEKQQMRPLDSRGYRKLKRKRKYQMQPPRTTRQQKQVLPKQENIR